MQTTTTDPRLTPKADWQTQQRGTNSVEYEIYLTFADNGSGIDTTTGRPLKTFNEWLNS